MPAEASILFINKTPRSRKLTQSCGSARARIYSHVQRGARYQRSVGVVEKDQALYQAPSSWTTESPKAERSQKNRKSNKSADSSLVLQPSSKSATLNILSGGTGDPFDCLKAPMSPYMEDLFKFYSSDIVPRVFPIKEVANTARMYTLTQAFEDPLQRDALLCTTSAAIYADSGVSRHGIAAMTFKGRALASLHRQLSSRKRCKASSFSSIYAVALLLWVECLFGNEEDLATHIIGLERLIDNSDVQIFDAPLCIIAALFACSYLGAALLDVAPTLKPVQIGDRNKISRTTQEALHSILNGPNPMASRLFSKHQNFLGPDLLEVATKQRTVMHFHWICRRGTYEPSFADVQYIYGQEMAVEYQLTALRADMSLSPAQHAVRLALFIFPQPFILVAKPNAAFCRAMTKRMMKWLNKSNLVSLWAPRCDLLFWVLFVTAHISIGEPTSSWVLSYLSTLINFLGIRSLEEMETVLNGFYYHPLYFRMTVETIWAKQAAFSPVMEREHEDLSLRLKVNRQD